MARSLFGVDKSDLNAYLNHMQKAVVYTTSQTTGTVMRTNKNGKARKLPSARAAGRQHRPTMYSSTAIDSGYLALHPYTP